MKVMREKGHKNSFSEPLCHEKIVMKSVPCNMRTIVETTELC